jgi:hypothetical protein
VKADKELLWLPVMSVFALMLIVGSIVVPVALLGGFNPDVARADAASASWLGVLAFYVVAYFVALFFNTALVGAAMIRLDGGNPTLADGLRIAWSRAGRILGYACIAATVGLLLRMIEERVGWVGRIVVKLIGLGWALATFLVVPVLATRDVGPIDAVKESATLLRETWGENLIGTFGLGLVFTAAYAVLTLVFVVMVFLAAQAQLPAVIAAVVLVGVVSFLVLSALQATMQGVYSAALYRYATKDANAMPGFDVELLQQAFKPKA